MREAMPLRSVRVPRQLWDDAKAAAEENDEKISDVVRRALEDYVKRNR